MRRPTAPLSALTTVGLLLAAAGCGAGTTSDVTSPTAASASSEQATAFDGVYTMDTTEADGQKSDPNIAPENWGHWVFVFGRGRFAFTQDNNQASCTWGYGTYTVTGAQVEWLFTAGGGQAPTGAANEPGELFTFGWTRYRDTLTLNAVPGAVSPDVLLLKPWHRVSGTPSATTMNARCLPPAAALTW
jgi:hypothetical protein